MGDGASGDLPWGVFCLVLVAAMAVSAGLVVLLRPYMVRYALARPNARSSHKEPTPQGGGIAVVAATLAGVWLGMALTSFGIATSWQFLALTAAAAVLALTGAIDDIRGLGAVPRLLIQFATVGLVIALLPRDFNVVPNLPFWLERALLVFGAVWLVNLTNFMDGIDWMTVAEVVPVTAGVALLGLAGAAPASTVLAALALLGDMIGFAPFNRPVARLFLGDVGSLPVGLMLGWILIMLAGKGHLASALLLPLYYLADASITLARRVMRREAVWEAHRTHFYQRATDNGFSVFEVVARLLALNVALCLLAAISIVLRSPMIDVICVAIGCAGVGFALQRFSRPRVS